MSLSAHKFYGPKGVGLLYVRRGTDLVPVITGGGHEWGRRPGTVNVAGAVGLAGAWDLVQERREQENARLSALRDRLIEGILDRIPETRLTGHPTRRAAHHASFAFHNVEGASVVVALDLEGVAASSGAACEEGEAEPSFVLQAMGYPPEWGIGAVRFSLGHTNTADDVERVLGILPPIVARLREEGQGV
jgi:cysteine desulfurase